MNLRLKHITIIIIIIIIGVYLFFYGFLKKEVSLINNGEPIIFAHRGVNNYCVENSGESFNLADKLNFQALEIDISQTKDGVIVVFHDENCKRLINIDTNICDVNYASIKDKKLIYKGKKSNNKILTLNSFLNKYQKDKIIYLDIKTPTKQLADSLLIYLEKSKNYKTTLIADASIFFLLYVKIRNHNIRTVLEGFNKNRELLYYIFPHKYKPDFYSSFLSEVDSGHIAFLKKNDLIKRKIVYGVNKSNLNEAIHYGLQNIIIDYDSTMIDADNIVMQLKEYNR